MCGFYAYQKQYRVWWREKDFAWCDLFKLFFVLSVRSSQHTHEKNPMSLSTRKNNYQSDLCHSHSEPVNTLTISCVRDQSEKF